MLQYIENDLPYIDSCIILADIQMTGMVRLISDGLYDMIMDVVDGVSFLLEKGNW